jgi:hypothetical protein
VDEAELVSFEPQELQEAACLQSFQEILRGSA